MSGNIDFPNVKLGFSEKRLASDLIINSQRPKRERRLRWDSLRSGAAFTFSFFFFFSSVYQG